MFDKQLYIQAKNTYNPPFPYILGSASFSSRSLTISSSPFIIEICSAVLKQNIFQGMQYVFYDDWYIGYLL